MLQTLWILQTKESKSNDMANEKLYDSALRLLAYNGDSDAQYNIAKYYETNEVDIDQSIFWYSLCHIWRKVADDRATE